MYISKNPILNIKEDSTILPIELTTVKNFLKVDFDEDDELIKKMIKTAIIQCETNINKSISKKTFVYSIYEIKNNSLILPYSPINSIESIKIIYLNQTQSILSDNEYFLDSVGGILNFKNRPSNFYRIDIEYKAGLTSLNDELIQGLLMHIARMYEDRSGYSPIPLNSLNIYKKYKQVRL